MRTTAVLLTLLLLIVTAAGAQPPPAETDGILRKCVAVDGAVSYQDAPCAAATRTAWERNVPPEPASAPRSPPTFAAPATRASGTSSIRRSRAASRRPADDACTRARARRERVLAEVGLRRTFSLLRTLDDEVVRACRAR